MRFLLTLLFIYFAFLIQSAITHFTPDLVLMLVVIFALYWRKSSVLILSLLAGFCLDLVNPTIFGFNLIICLAAGFSINSLQEYIYHGGRYLVVFLGLVLIVKYLLALILFKASLPFVEFVLSSLITLILVVPFNWLIQSLLPSQWKPA